MKLSLYQANLDGEGVTIQCTNTTKLVALMVTAGDPTYTKAGEDGDAGRTVTDYAVGVVVSMSGVSVGGSYRADRQTT